MKITISTGEEYCRGVQETIEVSTNNGSGSVWLGEGEPEDMFFGRDLPTVDEIQSLIMLAYEAGKVGEELEVVEVDESEDNN